jgi:hypothetical protein
MTDVFALDPHDQSLAHGRLADRLRDFNDLPQAHRSKIEADAQVASGDFFATLATLLDTISIDIAKLDEANHLLLERAINTLLYLQTSYKIVKKK